MKCPFCNYCESRVVDSRATENGEKIKRRRECVSCKHRFTTFEIVEETPIFVVKRDNTRERFNKNKLLEGFLRACEKRPISIDILEDAVNEVEKRVRSIGEKEVRTELIGDYCMESLKKIDDVAYIRFASVYRQFDAVENFVRELESLRNV